MTNTPDVPSGEPTPKSNEAARAILAVFVFLAALAVGIVFVVISPSLFGMLMFLLFLIGGIIGGYQVRKSGG